jgi:hypothetical protein
MKYKDFNDWFFEGEEYAQRCERFHESLDQFKSDLGRSANMLIWLQAAFEAGRQEAQNENKNS